MRSNPQRSELRTTLQGPIQNSQLGDLKGWVAERVATCLAELEIAQSVHKTNDAGYKDAVGGVVIDDARDTPARQVT